MCSRWQASNTGTILCSKQVVSPARPYAEIETSLLRERPTMQASRTSCLPVQSSTGRVGCGLDTVYLLFGTCRSAAIAALD